MCFNETHLIWHLTVKLILIPPVHSVMIMRKPALISFSSALSLGPVGMVPPWQSILLTSAMSPFSNGYLFLFLSTTARIPTP